MTNDEIRAFMLEWHGRHGQPNAYPRADISLNHGIDFIFVKAIKNATYPTVFGYYLDAANVLHCRHFYKSVSESSWRVGTGLRNEGGWVKGAEGSNADQPGGYIFEGMVNWDLEQRLETYYGTATDSGEFLASMRELWLPGKKTSYYTISQIEDSFIRFFIRPLISVNGIDNPPSGIVADYVQANIRWRRAIPQDIMDGIPRQGALKMNATLFQEHAFRTSAPVMGKTNYAKEIKAISPLWDLINECLRHHQFENTTKHVALNENINIHTYLLASNGLNIYIEIAESENKSRQFNTNSGISCSISSPICWVRSVYIGQAISTFGNYQNYPVDLCFLVQKPLDYIAQTSEFLATRSNVKTRIIETPNKDITIPPTKTLAFMNNEDHPNIIQKDGRNSYLLLALFDEKYSPLIQAYKESKRYPMFRWSSPKYMLNLLTAFNASLTNIRSELCRLVVDSCDDYLGMTNADKKAGGGSHGDHGTRRVTAFKVLIQGMTVNGDVTALNNAIYSLFNNNRVGDTSFASLFGGKINTNTYSYFTIFCRYILRPFFLVPDTYNVKTSMDKLKGTQNTIARLYLKAVDLDINGANLANLTSVQSAALLAALKAS